MSQLERLARPFPSKYVKKPAQGKYGSYVPHDVVQQALLAILGPVNINVGQVFYGEDGKVEGCLVTLTAVIDGQWVDVTEVGDCEQPGNWKTQGARMKDCISDGVKRCAMRLGLGLHLWAQEDYFLYDQLRQENAGDAEATRSVGATQSTRSDGATPSPSPATSPSSLGESTGGGVTSSSPPAPDATPPISKARREKLKSRCVALNEIPGVSIADEREALHLPLVDSCSLEQIEAFEAMVDEIEKRLEAPFAEATT